MSHSNTDITKLPEIPTTAYGHFVSALWFLTNQLPTFNDTLLFIDEFSDEPTEMYINGLIRKHPSLNTRNLSLHTNDISPPMSNFGHFVDVYWNQFQRLPASEDLNMYTNSIAQHHPSHFALMLTRHHIEIRHRYALTAQNWDIRHALALTPAPGNATAPAPLTTLTLATERSYTSEIQGCCDEKASS
jgi:hypothetical protein